MPHVTKDNKLIHFDFAELASVGFALFDIRNWYNGFLRVIKAGERAFSQCFSTWNLFTDTVHVAHDDSGNICCPMCKERPLGGPLGKDRSEVTSRAIPRTTDKKMNNNSGAWIFVPDMNVIPSGRSSGTRKTSEESNLDDNCSDSSDESVKYSAPRSSSTGRRATKKNTQRSSKSTKQKGRVLSAKKIKSSPKKSSNRSPKNPKKCVKKQLLKIEKSIPLVSQRPKRHRINNF
ncbi:hypothetical protein TNIN_267771 [Trichonephila inaurata madagascariensis]|uniref:Uncharacterized protein n=1 Tax=Trichonephila inaurata madagascariensis TaxID=2747483 RepID=A0A8X6WX79_9ARAC|nr:hypothetical protein TNIN_267771 [Trichonephila inaurata madagascariensis]